MSKAQKIHNFIEREVLRAVASVALDFPADAQILAKLHRSIVSRASFNIAYDVYRFKELADIMAWKKGPKRDY